MAIVRVGNTYIPMNTSKHSSSSQQIISIPVSDIKTDPNTNLVYIVIEPTYTPITPLQMYIVYGVSGITLILLLIALIIFLKYAYREIVG